MAGVGVDVHVVVVVVGKVVGVMASMTRILICAVDSGSTRLARMQREKRLFGAILVGL